jgi:hypothetical protein
MIAGRTGNRAYGHSLHIDNVAIAIAIATLHIDETAIASAFALSYIDETVITAVISSGIHDCILLRNEE